MTVTDTIPQHGEPDDRFRRVTWTVWLAWILVAALDPVLSSIEATSFNTDYAPGQPYVALFNLTLGGLIVSWLGPPIAQGFILRRIAPKLSVWFWVLGIALIGLVWMLFKSGVRSPGPQALAFQADIAFRHAMTTAQFAGTLSSHILDLPWGPLLMWSALGSAAMAALPAWIVSFSTARRGDGVAVLVAAIVAGCAAIIVEQLYNIYGIVPTLPEWALNNKPWPAIYQIVAQRSGVGAVWGAASAFVFVLLTRQPPTPPKLMPQRPIGLVLMAASCVAIAFLAPSVGYLAGAQGLRAGAPALWKSLSFEPAQDRSQGGPVLTYSHDIAVPLARYASLAISPNSRTAIVRSAEHKLVRVDLETGRDLGAVTEALAPLERHAVLFRPDGRFLAVQSDGDEVAIAGTRYTKHQNRVRLYALPDFKLAGEFINRDGQCFDSFAREPMLFEPDGNSLWLVCWQYNAPKDDDIMAIRIEVPSMKQLDVWHYGDTAGSGPIRGLEHTGDSVWAWQFPNITKLPFRIRDLTHDREVLKLTIPAEPTAQTDASQIDDKTIKLNFCGQHSTAPDAAERFDRAASLCRLLTFDTQTGALLEQTDSSDFRFATTPSASLTGHDLRIESSWRRDSKSGETVVRDAASGRELQRIASVAERPLQWSPDGRWLIMHASDRNVLRVYRAKR